MGPTNGFAHHGFTYKKTISIVKLEDEYILTKSIIFIGLFVFTLMRLRAQFWLRELSASAETWMDPTYRSNNFEDVVVFVNNLPELLSTTSPFCLFF